MESGVDGDDILSKEWLRLSLKDRNDIQEEIHSVFCMVPEESPEMIREALEKLSFELVNNIPAEEQRAYLRSQELYSEDDDGATTTTYYINEDGFRLRFLRLELFDIPKAARRMCRFLDCLLENFGEDCLKRPVSVKDFSKEDLKMMKKGVLQLLPYRDRVGRRILFIFPRIDLAEMPIRTKMKIMLYLIYVAGSDNNVDIQRKGYVIVVWYDSAAELDEPTRIKTNVQTISNIFPFMATRIAAIHLCTPDTPMHRLRRSILTAAVSFFQRTRMKVHIGTPMELRYTLNGFGIPTDSLPISWTGNVKTSYLKQFIRVRQVIEHDDSFLAPGPLPKMTKTQRQLVVECPNLNDIIFKKGCSGMQHPGNVLFRSLVQSKYEQGNLLTTKSLITATLEEIQQQGLRVLVWNEKESCFLVIRDQQMIYKKIEYLVRDFQFSSTRSQTINRRIADAIATSASAVSSPKTVSSATQTTENLESATSIFRGQDGSSRKRFKSNRYCSNIDDCSDDSSENSGERSCLPNFNETGFVRV